jgi:hypothetical protein
MRKIISSIFAIILLTGCATITGPSVSSEEILKAEEELKVKALEFQLKQLARVNNIGYRLISSLCKEDYPHPSQPFLGFYVHPIDKYLKRLYNLDSTKALVVILVIQDSPAEKAGLQEGDVLLAVDNNVKIASMRKFNTLIKSLNIGQRINIQILRGQKKEYLDLKVGSIPIDIPIAMVDIQQVNAAATGNAILITYGLVNFAKSDDEIAAVLGHELAHITRGHLAKAGATNIISFLASLALGIVAENASAGTGSAVMRSVNNIAAIFGASYSRDLEREADYFGTKYVYQAGFDVDACATFMERFAIEIPRSMIRNYLSTHPTSAERSLRIRKIIEELKKSSPQNK